MERNSAEVFWKLGRIAVEELGGIFIEGGLGGVPVDGFKGNALLPEAIKVFAFHHWEMGESFPVTEFHYEGMEFEPFFGEIEFQDIVGILMPGDSQWRERGKFLSGCFPFLSEE